MVKTEYIFALLGAALLALGATYPLVTLVVDTTAPSLVSSVPASGATYSSLNTLSATVKDDVSGVQAVYISVTDASNNYVITQKLMSLTSGDKMSGTWTYTPTSTELNGINQVGKHICYIQAEDYAGNWLNYGPISFTIYTQLQGKWYINNQEITSTSQTVYSTSATVTFKFQKTAGIDDKYITCTVVEGSSTILTLSLTDSTNHIWTGSYTFTSGTHNIQLKAYDGTTTITFSVIGLGIPGATTGWTMTTQQTLILASIICLAAAGIIHIRKPRARKKIRRKQSS